MEVLGEKSWVGEKEEGKKNGKRERFNFYIKIFFLTCLVGREGMRSSWDGKGETVKEGKTYRRKKKGMEEIGRMNFVQYIISPQSCYLF